MENIIAGQKKVMKMEESKDEDDPKSPQAIKMQSLLKYKIHEAYLQNYREVQEKILRDGLFKMAKEAQID